MTRAPLIRRTNDDTTSETLAGDGDPHSVTQHELLAENMPSVLARLRPIDTTSDGILRYFRSRDSRPRRLDAARGARS